MIIDIEKNYEELGMALEHKGFSDDAIDAYFLEHYGVSGMKWGQRKASRQRNRALNKSSRQADREKHSKEVQRARDKFDSGQVNKEWKKAKAQHKINKQELGSREARKILNKTKEKHWREFDKAQQAKDGKEVATAMLVAGGVMALSFVLSNAAGSAGRSRGF